MSIQVWLNSACNLLVFVALLSFFVYLISRSEKVMHFVAAEKPEGKGIVFVIILLGVAIMLASKFAPEVGTAKTNIRDALAFIAAIVGGPIAGIVVGLIGGIYRYTLGGWTALPCCLATIFAGLLGALIVYKMEFVPKKISSKTIINWAIIGFLWEVVHLQVLVPLFGEKMFWEGFNAMATKLLIPMSIMNVVAIVTFLLLIKDMVLNDSRLALDEQNKLIAEVEELRMKVWK